MGTTRIDLSGRILAKALVQALGWEPGQRLVLTMVQDTRPRHSRSIPGNGTATVGWDGVRGALVVVGADPAGGAVVDRRGGFLLPAPMRKMCAIEPGPPLVLAASVQRQVLVIHTQSTVAELLTDYYRTLLTPPLADQAPPNTSDEAPGEPAVGARVR